MSWLEPDGHDPHSGSEGGPDPGTPNDDGRRRRRAVVAALGVAVVVTLAVVTWPDADPTPPRPVAAPSASRAPATTGGQSEEASTISRVTALADYRGPAVDYVRQTSAAGSCPAVRPGRSPARDIAAVTRAAVPGFDPRATSRTLDQFTGLCSMELRAAPAANRVLTLSIAAPAPDARRRAESVRSGSQLAASGVTTRWVLAGSRGGWTVLVGARGAAARLPSLAQLTLLARSDALLWSP